MPNTKILYLEAQKRNFVEKFLQNNPQGYWMRPEDGKIDWDKRMAYNTPWVYHKSGPNMDCHFWHKVLFDIVHGQQKVPIPCQSCWKIVVFPRDLEELFALHLLQRELDLPSKCGSEVWRVNTPRHYGGYFYNQSYEQGMERFKVVTEALAQDRDYTGLVMGCPIKVRFNNNSIGYHGPIRAILKRGCTEYEQNVGPSDQWTWDEDQAEVEAIAQDTFVQDIVGTRQTYRQRAEVFMKWIHGAFQVGDEKYKLFTNGNRLFRDTITYHDKDKDWVEKALLGQCVKPEGE